MARYKAKDIPKPEIIEGEIDFPEMIKADFRKALIIIGLTLLATMLTTAGLLAIFLFLR